MAISLIQPTKLKRQNMEYLFYTQSQDIPIPMDIYAIRRNNTRVLAQQLDPARPIMALAESLGKEQSYISQIIGENATRNIGPNISKQIERAFGKPNGWLDQSHTTNERNFDINSLESAIRTVEEILTHAKKNAPPELKAKFVATAFLEAQETGQINKQTIERMIRMFL